MIPVRLTLEGVNSYRARTVIDFEPLVSARLFGIFGTVGSGKSSILEAMTLALYGESSRLGHQDRRSYNLLNLRSDRLWIDFVFSVFSDETGRESSGNLFRFTLEVRRGRKRFDDTGTMKRSAYRWDGGQWEPRPEADGAAVLGLSYDNFKRTTIIPQGRFQEFLQLKPKDRTQMLQELFSLERFDLFNRVGSLYRTAESRLNTVDGALAETSPAVADDLEVALNQRSELQSAREEIERAVQGAQQRRAAAIEVVRVAEQLGEHRRRLEELDRRREEITALEERVSTLQVVERFLVGALDRENTARERKEREESLLEAAVAARDTAQAKEEDARITLKQREERAAGLEALQEEATRLEAVARVISRRAEREQPARELQEALLAEQQAQEAVSAARAREKELTDRLEIASESASEAGPEVAPETILEDAPEPESAPGRALAREDVVAGLSEIIRAREELARLEGLDGDDRRETVPPSRMDEELARARREYAAFQVDAHLQHLVEHLEEGEPCPLCGSREHPHPRVIDTGELHHDAEAEKKVQELEALRDRRLRRSAERAAVVERLREIIRMEPSDPEKVRQVLGEREEHLQAARERYQAQDAIREEIESLRAVVAEATDYQTKSTTQRHEREQTLASLDAVIADHLGALDDRGRELADAASPKEGGPEQILNRAEQTRREIRETREALHEAREKHHATATSLAEEKARTRELEERTSAAREEHAAAAATLDRLTREHSMTDRAVLEEARHDLPHLESYREKVADYHQRRRTLSDAIRDLERGTPEKRPDVETARRDLHDADRVVKELDERRTVLDSELGTLKERIGKLTKEQERRNELTTERDALSVRVENLRVLRNLFKGGGFVNYVAQVFLTELVTVANTRFQRLTRNQLCLALREDNEFEVIDFLNGGHRRSIKTLSGGQTFQAALCLALALVDSIDRGGSRFFFLDEGFGSLDAESLREVFETLKDLRREERIVGVISHVETMQEEVDTCLVVTRDEEYGSRITPSWGGPPADAEPVGAGVDTPAKA